MKKKTTLYLNLSHLLKTSNILAKSCTDNQYFNIDKNETPKLHVYEP